MSLSTLTERACDLRKALFPKATSRTLLAHYLPMVGACCHSAFHMHVFNPQTMTRLFPVWDLAVSNAILFTSHLGAGFYVFFRPHLFKVPEWDRVQFSVFSSVMFNFGSLLLAVLVKPLIPTKSVPLKAILGAALSSFLLWTARKYLDHIDSRTLPMEDYKFDKFD
uniref:Conserved plasma membrane protein n=1 Tax=Steinernema glaseri TaxID=37863 RepID=A0A1I7Z567_9BILA